MRDNLNKIWLTLFFFTFALAKCKETEHIRLISLVFSVVCELISNNK